MNLLLSILSGVLLAFAFPKFNLYWLAWIALVPFFVALSRARDWKEALQSGFFFGIAFFSIHLFWVTTLFRFVKWWIVLGWVSLVLFQTLFILLFVILSRFFISGLLTAGFERSPFHVAANALVGKSRRTSNEASIFKSIISALGVAAVWTFIEWLRACGPFGVTGGDLGYSQVRLLPLIQIAALTSVYGVSFLVVLVNVAIANVVQTFRSANKIAGLKTCTTFLIIVFLLVIGCYGYGSFVMGRGARGVGRIVKLALIQPNIDQKDKMDPDKVMPIFDLHEKMTRQAIREKPDVIIWPETAIFSYLLHDSVLLPRIKRLAVDSGSWLVLGTPHYVGRKTYNSIISMSPSGKVVSRYDKQQLVPFGEYLPFRRILYPILKGVGYYDSEFNSNPHPEPIKVKNLKIAAAVCFESTFPHLIRERVRKNSDFILLVTNDAWFGDSSALYFHLNTGVFRAIENRKYFIQVGNTGLSAVIDPYGRVLKETNLNRREILTFELPTQVL